MGLVEFVEKVLRPQSLCEKALRPLSFCECGCGGVANPRYRFVYGHGRRGQKYWRIQKGRLPCECGCGELAKAGNRFINGHNMRGVQLSEEHRKNLSIALKGKYTGEKASGYGRTGKKCPNYGRHPSEETRKKLSIAKIGKYLGKNNPSWKGGISLNLYPQEFNSALRRQIKERDNYTCQNLECETESPMLCIHHIDYDKKNNSPENLITLCISCNVKANINRDYWKSHFQTLMKFAFPFFSEMITNLSLEK